MRGWRTRQTQPANGCRTTPTPAVTGVTIRVSAPP